MSTQFTVEKVDHATKTVTISGIGPLPSSARMTMEQAYGSKVDTAGMTPTAEMGPVSSDGTQENGCPATHAEYGRCERTDAHGWHRASGEKWMDGTNYSPTEKDSSGAAVAKPEESAAVAATEIKFPSGASMKVVVVAEGDERLRGQPFALETDIPPAVAEVLAKQQAAQVEAPAVDKSVAPEGTVRAVYTGSAASRLAPAIEEEMKRLLALKPELVPLPKEKPTDPPRAQCPACDVIVVGFDASHGCTKDDVLKKLKPRGLHEALGDKLKFSGRYRLCVWRDPEGQYHLAEELVDENGAIVAFNVLDGGESWGYMGARILDLIVEKFTP